MYGRIDKPFWDDRPVAVVAGGPSMKDFDFEQLRGAHVLAVKGAIFGIPWADAGFGLDMSRLNECRDKLARLECRIYWAVSEEDRFHAITLIPNTVTLLKRIEGQGVSETPDQIYAGGTSSFGALQICIHKRARTVVLFGYDYDGTYNGALHRGQMAPRQWAQWADDFAIYVPHLERRGIQVINACPRSAIGCFPKASLRDGVAMVREKALA